MDIELIEDNDYGIADLSDMTFFDTRFVRCDFRTRMGTYTEFRNCVFVKCVFPRDLGGCRFIDCRFESDSLWSQIADVLKDTVVFENCYETFRREL